MPIAAVAYKDAYPVEAEALDLDERLWAHVRLATSFAGRQRATSSLPDAAASAVVVRSGDGERVVVILVDREAGRPGARDVCAQFNLTSRETEVALLLADRMSCREIAERLNMSFHTARTHTERILQKLGVRSKHDVRACLGVGQ